MTCLSPIWAPVGRGRLALWHRPGRRLIPHLPAQGCDRVITLLSEREGAPEIGALVEEAGMAWSWIPLAGARPPEEGASLRMWAGLDLVAPRLTAGESQFIHCSAGIHRTGMIALALLRLAGLSETEARERIARSRPESEAGLTAARIAWAMGPPGRRAAPGADRPEE